MSGNKYKRKYEFQQKLISRQSEQIEELKFEVENLNNECRKKDEIINSVSSLKEELTCNVNDIKKYKKEYKELIDELRKMKEIMNKEVYKGKWNLIKLFVK